jgi:hypothetical protein
MVAHRPGLEGAWGQAASGRKGQRIGETSRDSQVSRVVCLAENGRSHDTTYTTHSDDDG